MISGTMQPFSSSAGRGGRQLLLAALLYLILLSTAFVPKWVAGYSFLTEVIWDPTPVYLQYPTDMVTIHTFAAGQLGGLWDPSRGFGTQPFIPNYLLSYGHILKLPVYLLHAPWAWEAYLLLRLLLAGIFTFLLARSLPLPFLPAFFAGAGYMLCGYFRIFLNFQHLNLEVFFPALLWSLLLFFRRRSLGRFLAALFFLFQMWAASNPTVLAYAILLSGAFSLFLAALAGQRSPRPWLTIGFGLGLYLLLWGLSSLWFASGWAGVEFTGQVWKLRLPGIAWLRDPLDNLIALATPLFDYWLSPLPPTHQAQLALLNFVPGYLGTVVSALALIAILHPGRLPRTGLFFILALPFTLGLVFGIPPFHLLAGLPVLRDSQNFRYVQGFVALSAALAAGMGLHLFLTGPAPITRRTAAILAGLLAWILWHLLRYRHFILASPLFLRFLLGVGLVLALTGLLLAAARFGRRITSPRALAALALSALAAGELLLYFHLTTPLYGAQAYAMTEPPAAAWLRSRPRGFRLYGAEPESLHPNLAGIFGLEDVRDSTPIYLRRYLRFIAAADGLQSEREILDHYFEQGRFYMGLDLDRLPPRLLDLMNVRYLLTHQARDRLALALSDPSARWLMPQAGNHYLAGLEAEINGVRRAALLTHAPARADLPLPAAASRTLVGDVGILPEARLNPQADGAWAIASCPAAAGARLVFSRFLNPRLQAGERDWIPIQADLPPDCREIAFSALPGPRDNPQSDFAVWGEPGLWRADPWRNLKLVYDRDLRIYENSTVLPRAFWAERAEWLSSDQAVLDRLTGEGFDPGQRVLIHARPPWPPAESEPGPAEVELVEHEFGRARVKVRAEGGGWLVLTDLYYPGWEARVDGNEARIYPVDVAFRGLPLPPGEHDILFRYNPGIIHLAVWMMLVSYLCVPLTLLLRQAFRVKDAKPAPGPAEAGEGHGCPVCGQSPLRPWLGPDLGLLQCRHCAVIFYPPLETLRPEVYYDESYYFETWPGSLGKFFRDFDPAGHPKTALMMDQIEKLKTIHPGMALLDVGCANGVFVWLAEKAGWQAEGIDISPFAVQWGRQQFGVNLRVSRLEQLHQAGSYDLISFWDTLEHMPAPSVVIGHAYRRLKPGGRLLISTPDEGSLVNHGVNLLHRLSWGASKNITRKLYHPDHLFFFNQLTLTRLLEKAGFEVETIECYDETPEDTETRGALRVAVAIVRGLARLWGREHQMLVLARKR